jgi:hypothetical protein
LGVKYAYTIELTRGYGFVYPEKLINSYAEIVNKFKNYLECTLSLIYHFQVLPGIQVLAQKVAN